MDSPSTDFAEPGRIELIKKIHNWNEGEPVATDAWACIWLSDLGKLRKLVDGVLKNDAGLGMLVQMLFIPENISSELVSPWLNRERTTSIAPTSTAGVTNSQRNLNKQEVNRDKKCIITKASQCTEAAHICPSSMAEHLTSRRSLKWVLLGEFWSDEDIQSWQQTLLTPSKIEIPQNLINMEKTVHAAWDNCMFALKHIQTTPDQKTMELEFHWLHIRPRGTGLVSLLEMSDLPPNNSSGRGNLKFWNCLTERKICSGDRIVLRTEDPDKFPLPSEELLKMRWHLNRVAALSGASEVLDFHRQEDNPFIVR